MTVGLDGGGDPDLMTQLFPGCSRAVPGLFPGKHGHLASSVG